MSRTCILYKVLDPVSKLKIDCLQEHNFTGREAAGICFYFSQEGSLMCIFCNCISGVTTDHGAAICQLSDWIFFIDCSESSLKGEASSL